MKAYKVELLILDFDGLGEDGVAAALENTRFANDCITPKVVKMEQADIGEWNDNHPLNQKYSTEKEFNRLFPNREAKKFQVMADKLLAHCPDGECATCSEIVCPHEDPMHFHHDGCPSCDCPHN